MRVLKYQKQKHEEIIEYCASALRAGEVVAYPTDTSYGLAVDAANPRAIKKLYRIKERGFRQPVHVVLPDLDYAQKLVEWPVLATRLADKFWPGALTLVLKLKSRRRTHKALCADTGYLGVRLTKNRIAQDLAKTLGRPITATSANPSARLSGGFDSYSAQDVARQFRRKTSQPDLVVDAGVLPRRKPSTLVKIEGERVTVLRQGPVSEKQIIKTLNLNP